MSHTKTLCRRTSFLPYHFQYSNENSNAGGSIHRLLQLQGSQENDKGIRKQAILAKSILKYQVRPLCFCRSYELTHHRDKIKL